MFKRCIALAFALILTGCASAPTEEEEIARDLEEFEIGHINYPSANPTNGSIYSAESSQFLLGNGRRYHAGDLIIVNMDESINAKDSIDTKSKSQTHSKAGGAAGISLLGGYGADGDYNFYSDKKADGSGSTSQSHSLSGSIACTVTKVLPNGLLEIKGTKTLTLEKGTETIALSGYIREQDISTTNNTINSDRIANAKIYYRGEGYIYEKSTEGWFSDFMTGKWWPF